MDGCKLVELEKKLRKEQGTVTRERLEELLGEAIDPGKVAIVVDLVFSALDLPEDGGIEVESLSHLVETKDNSREMLMQRLRWLFRMYDTDASGTISLGEMVEIFSGLYLAEVSYSMIYIKHIIFCPSEVICDDVLLYIMFYLAKGLDLDVAVDRAEQIFAELDDDHDGEITESEFIEGCLQDEVGYKE